MFGFYEGGQAVILGVSLLVDPPILIRRFIDVGKYDRASRQRRESLNDAGRTQHPATTLTFDVLLRFIKRRPDGNAIPESRWQDNVSYEVRVLRAASAVAVQIAIVPSGSHCWLTHGF
jgi:hypothetical protein